ncbi:MAG: T9SS type A sorting domain-containing protein [Chitinophagaceae bacterium]
MPFVSLANLPSTNKGIYQYQHLVQNIGSYYYRIKAIDIHGNIQYSNIVHILNDAEVSDAKVLVYPNPIQLQSGIKLQLNQLPKDVYELQLVDNSGKQVLKTTIIYQQNQSYYTISLTKHIAYGMYQLNIKGKEMNYHQTVFIQP